jgi:hypothetical protein
VHESGFIRNRVYVKRGEYALLYHDISHAFDPGYLAGTEFESQVNGWIYIHDTMYMSVSDTKHGLLDVCDGFQA